MLHNAVVLGIVEGVTEFLPISSTGHLILVNRFIEFTGEFANLFDVVIQLGAILAVVVYFWNRLYPFSPQKSPEKKREVWLLWKKAVAGVIPAILIGGVLGHKIQERLFNPTVVGAALLLGGIILIAVEQWRKGKPRIETLAALSYKTALLIGLIQCLSMIPGTSRSAATIIGAMLLGASRQVAVEYSFFLAIPTMAAASAYSFLKMGKTITAGEMGIVAVGFLVSFLTAWAVIAFFIRYIRNNDFKLFGYYRILIGALILLFFRF